MITTGARASDHANVKVQILQSYILGKTNDGHSCVRRGPFWSFSGALHDSLQRRSWLLRRNRRRSCCHTYASACARCPNFGARCAGAARLPGGAGVYEAPDHSEGASRRYALSSAYTIASAKPPPLNAHSPHMDENEFGRAGFWRGPNRGSRGVKSRRFLLARFSRPKLALFSRSEVVFS